MGHHVVDGSFSIIILSKALTDTSRDVITIFQELLILMLPLKLLSMFEKHPSECHWNLPSISSPKKGVATVIPREHKEVASKENKHWEGGKHHWTYCDHGNWFQVSSGGRKKKQEKFANLPLQIMGQFLKVKLWSLFVAPGPDNHHLSCHFTDDIALSIFLPQVRVMQLRFLSVHKNKANGAMRKTFASAWR